MSILVRLPSNDHQAILRAAKESGKTLNQWCWDVLLSAATRTRAEPDLVKGGSAMFPLTCSPDSDPQLQPPSVFLVSADSVPPSVPEHTDYPDAMETPRYYLKIVQEDGTPWYCPWKGDMELSTKDPPDLRHLILLTSHHHPACGCGPCCAIAYLNMKSLSIPTM